jgi:hypothetical protein
MSASATETDCQAAREMVQAERTVLRAGQVLDRTEVGAPDVLASAWRQENTQIRDRMRLDRCPLMADGGLWVYRLGGPYRAWIDGQPARPIAPTAAAARLACFSSTHTINGLGESVDTACGGSAPSIAGCCCLGSARRGTQPVDQAIECVE